MSKRKQRHLSPAGFILALILLIVLIFSLDAVYRMFFQSNTENIVGVDGFSLNAPASDDASAAPTENGENTEETTPAGNQLSLDASAQSNGSLILVDAAHPYTGSQSWTNFSAVTNENVKPRDTAFSFQPELTESLTALFDAYAAENGYCNLQIYSTLDTTLDASSIYTNVLPDRSSGYGFDIGLITSTGEVVPYIKKNNEWMTANAWKYGFVMRYPSDKAEVTGVSYAPHHFRYVGKIHAAIMHENNFCLEEYLNYLQAYTMESGGLSYSDGTQSFLIYYVPADSGGTTTVALPENASYTVSGDNRGGYIVTIVVDGSAATQTDTNPAETTAPIT